MFPVTCKDNPFIVAEQFLDPASNSRIHRHQRAWRSEKMFRLGCLVCSNIVMPLRWCFQCNWSWSSKQLCQLFVGREASARQSKWKRSLWWKQRGHRRMCVAGQSLSHGVWNQIWILRFVRYHEGKYFCYLQKHSIAAPVVCLFSCIFFAKHKQRSYFRLVFGVICRTICISSANWINSVWEQIRSACIKGTSESSNSLNTTLLFSPFICDLLS